MFSHHYFRATQQDWSVFWGAFAGAFLAFIFGLVAYWVTKRRERFVQHKNTLVKLDRVLMKHLFELGRLQELMLNTIQSLAYGHTTSNRLNLLVLPEGVEVELGSLELADNIF